jgi:hypothetical protein
MHARIAVSHTKCQKDVHALHCAIRFSRRYILNHDDFVIFRFPSAVATFGKWLTPKRIPIAAGGHAPVSPPVYLGDVPINLDLLFPLDLLHHRCQSSVSLVILRNRVSFPGIEVEVKDEWRVVFGQLGGMATRVVVVVVVREGVSCH